MKKLTVLLLALIGTSTVFAETQDRFPVAKLQPFSAQLSSIYAGLGISQRLLHANVEWVNSYGIVYAKLGGFLKADNGFGAQLGYRYPYYLTGKNQNGYYVGVFAGYLDRLEIDSEYKDRFGVGVDLAYLILDAEKISTASVGIGFAQKLEGQYGSVDDFEPKIQFSYSLSFDVF